MLTHPMLDQLAKLGLSGMAQAFTELEASAEGASLTHADWLGLLVDREVTHRRDKRLVARLRHARLRHQAVVEDIDYRARDGRYARIMHSLNSAQLLILDDWGLDPLDASARRDLYEILEERYARRSTILTSQVPVDKWHEVIGDPTYADAILDRLVHNAHRIDLAGDSLRRTRPRSAAKD